MSPEGVAALERVGSPRTLREGEVLFLQAERAARVAVVRTGLLKITAARPDAGYCVLGLRGIGELVGEVAAIDGRSRTATVTAVAPTSVLMFRLREFREVIDGHPEVGMAVALSLVARMRESDELRLMRASMAVPRRLAHCLLRIADEHGHRTDGRVHIDLALTQDDLAGLVDSSRDAVAKTLHQWRADGLVETGRRHIVLCDPDRLSVAHGW